ncbi:sugar ABC transporter ATP-binding protein [Vallitalea okinawensis]|uniref:sugar ABC transporter ATP-binding protein n=1 Tax=Vallitalea okinawensis TaxID=2078660 RepID=UPI000CFA88B1|nr:sugar ABC transporter ATP-binding protein [Vallitalea okinawensis]
MDRVLKAVDINKSFTGVQALKDVTLEIKPGEIHCLAGENGSGKSTLIKVIAGVYTPDDGHIEFSGQSYRKITPIDAIRHGVQVIYQDFSIFPNLSVIENLAFNTELANKRKLVNKKKMRQIAEEAIAKIDFQVDLEAKVGDLPVASKQLIAISRALMFNAKLIIMDEPTTALTRKEVNALFNIILNLKKQGIAILFVSHKLDEVFEIAERFTILRNGQLIFTGEREELNQDKFSYYMTGRNFESTSFSCQYIDDQPILEVKNLSQRGYFKNISFSLRKGQILGITGLLGSGRTELALSLFGINHIDSGTIKVGGEEVEIDSPMIAMRNKIGYVPEDRLTEGLFLKRSIGDNIIISEIDYLKNKYYLLDKKKVLKEIDKWVEELSIATPDPTNPCNTLSGGNQQRIVLAKWLTLDLDILILNGPSVGVDIGSKYDIHNILRELANKGLAILIISDDIPEVLSLCSDVLIMKNGEIAASLKTSETNVQELTTRMM